MKSIKEKATEYDKVVERISANTSIVDMSGRKQFEAGANYVLDAIEECFNPKDDIVKQWGAIATLIEQLKSNQ